MPMIKIVDDNGRITTSILIGYSFESLEEGLFLELKLPNSSVKYLIHSDRRNLNIYNIETFITNYFDNVLYWRRRITETIYRSKK